MNAVLLLTITMATVFADHWHPHHHSLTQILEDIRDSDRFEHMSQEEQLLLSELIMAATEGPESLAHFIDRVPLVNVLHFLKDLDRDDAVQFEDYLAQIMQQHGTVQKRAFSDLFEALKQLHEVEGISEHLPDSDRQHFLEILNAAHTNTLTQYIAKEGYGPIFRILSHVEPDHNDDLLDLLSRHLEKEATMAAQTS